jgi:hypothetical protein
VLFDFMAQRKQPKKRSRPMSLAFKREHDPQDLRIITSFEFWDESDDGVRLTLALKQPGCRDATEEVFSMPIPTAQRLLGYLTPQVHSEASARKGAQLNAPDRFADRSKAATPVIDVRVGRSAELEGVVSLLFFVRGRSATDVEERTFVVTAEDAEMMMLRLAHYLCDINAYPPTTGGAASTH